jgi:hypothetical protein
VSHITKELNRTAFNAFTGLFTLSCVAMPFTKENRRVFESVRRSHDIVFEHDLPRDSWPPNHRQVFESIQKLKTFNYDSYAAHEGVGVSTIPWKSEAKIQAKKLIEKAKDCVGRNEATWRLACEPLVFSRFNAEVAWYIP